MKISIEIHRADKGLTLSAFVVQGSKRGENLFSRGERMTDVTSAKRYLQIKVNAMFRQEVEIDWTDATDGKATIAVASEQASQAIRQVSENTDDDWREVAKEAIHSVCVRLETFICDDIWETGLPSTHNDKALGPVLMAAAKNGWCKKTDRVRPSVRSHMSGKPVWESLIVRLPV